MPNEIFNAEYCDIVDIIAINNANLLKNNLDGDAGKSGFLVAESSEIDLKNLINDKLKSLSVVLKRENEVLGYLIGFDIIKTEVDFQQQVFSLFESKGLNYEDDKVFYYSQIAKKPYSKNIGKNLVLSMFSEVKKMGYDYIVCRIVHSPIKNEVSMAFHHSLGFKYVGDIAGGGYLCGIYLYILVK